MRRPLHAITLLSAATLAIAPFGTALARRAPTSQTIVIHRHVVHSGVYELRIRLRGGPSTGDAVQVMVGHRVLLGTRATGRGVLRLRLVIRHANRSLTIAASGARLTKVHVSVHRTSALHSGGGSSQRTSHPRSHGSTTSPAASRGSTAPAPTAGSSTSVTASTGTGSSATVGSAAPSGVSFPAPPLSGGPFGVGGSWRLGFDDEFSGQSLDSTKWSTGWFGSGITAPVNSNELECYDPSQVVQTNGELDLNLIKKSETCGGTSRPYTSGLVTTNGKFSFTYGYIEVRSWLPADSSGAIADWPGIWTDGQSWPTDGELDVLEGLSGAACWHFHSTAGGPGGCANGTWTGGWHTFGADWEPGSVTYYYDGINVGTITTGITGAPMYIILGLGSDPSNTVTAPASQRTDYVRVWQH